MNPLILTLHLFSTLGRYLTRKLRPLTYLLLVHIALTPAFPVFLTKVVNISLGIHEGYDIVQPQLGWKMCL